MPVELLSEEVARVSRHGTGENREEHADSLRTGQDQTSNATYHGTDEDRGDDRSDDRVHLRSLARLAASMPHLQRWSVTVVWC